MPGYAVVYATNTSALRRVIATDDVAVFSREHDRLVCRYLDRPPTAMAILPGESVVIVSHDASEGHGHHDWAQAVADETGVYPPLITSALIQDNVVQHIICADPEIDAAPDGQSMVRCYSPQICIGCSYDPSTGLFTHPGGPPLPPHSPGNPTDKPIDVPPFVIPKP